MYDERPTMRWDAHRYNRQSPLLKPFEPYSRVKMTPEHVAEIAEAFGMPEEAVLAATGNEEQFPLFGNGSGPEDYLVSIRWNPEGPFVREKGPMMRPRMMPAMMHLSIKRQDREPVTDWRHKQEIKNMLVGPEFEAVELFPAESRVVDTANQYHLWVFGDTGALRDLGFPVGKRLGQGYALAKQRGFGA